MLMPIRMVAPLSILSSTRTDVVYIISVVYYLWSAAGRRGFREQAEKN